LFLRVCSELSESGEEQLENRRTAGLAVAHGDIDGRRFAQLGWRNLGRVMYTDSESRFEIFKSLPDGRL
jgi:hypothetical protein